MGISKVLQMEAGMKTKEEYLRERGLILDESELSEAQLADYREKRKQAEKSYSSYRNKSKYEKFKEEYIRVNCSISKKPRAGERKSDYELLKEVAGEQKLAGVLTELAFSKMRGRSTLLTNSALRESIERLDSLLKEVAIYRTTRENEARNIGFILDKVRTKGYAHSEQADQLLGIMRKLSEMDYTFYLEDKIRELSKRLSKPVREGCRATVSVMLSSWFSGIRILLRTAARPLC